MKTHLPVALRKALIAALFSLSVFAHGKAHAEVMPAVSSHEVTVSGNNQTYEYDGDIMVSPMDSASGYDALNLHAGTGADDIPGSITVESAVTTLYNPEIRAEGNITIGVDSDGNANEYQNLIIRGSGSTVIDAGGDIVFNHRVDAGVGQDASSGNGTGTDQTYTGTLSIHADGNITFDSIGVQGANVSTIRLAGGNTENDKASMTAGGDITVRDAGSSELAWTRYSEVSAGGDILVQLPYGNGIFSGVVDADGEFSFAGAKFTAMDPKDTVPSITAGTGISVYTSALNTVSSAELKAEHGDIELVSHGSGYSNYIYQAKATANDGDVWIESSNGRAYMISSELGSDTGNVGMTGVKVDAVQSSFTAAENLTLAGTSNTGLADVTATAETIIVGTETGDTNIFSESELESVHSSLSATGDIEVKGSRVNVSDATTVRSYDGSISIGAFGTYAEDPVAHRPMGGVNIREAEVEAQGDISITGAAVVMADASAISRGGEVPVTGETDFVSGEDTSLEGVVTIGGSVSTSLLGVELAGGTLSIGVSGGSTTIGSLSAEGQTKASSLDAVEKIEITGSSVGLNSVSVVSEGAADDGVSVSVTGTDVEIIGEEVSGAGLVAIGGSSSTSIIGVEIEGASVAVGDGGQTEIKAATSIGATGDVMACGDQVAVTGSDINSDSGTVSVVATTSNEMTGGATVSADTVAVSGPENTISGAGTQVTGTTDVTITGSTENEISGTAQAIATNGSVKVDGGATAVNTVTDAGTLVQAGAAVDMSGATNSIAAGARVESGTDAMLTAAISNEVLGGATVSADTVAVSGPENTISGAGTQVTGTTDVTIAGSTVNEISGTAQVVATNGIVKVDGGATAANTITDADTLVQTGTAVDMSGATNSIAAGARVEAGTIATFTAATSNEVGDGATVSADTVAVSGPENTISGTGTQVMGTTDVTIAGSTVNEISGTAQVVATNGNVKVDGGATAANTITDADTLVQAGAAVDMSGATNSIAAGARVEAGTDATLTAASSNEVIGGATVSADTVSVSGPENTISGTGTQVIGTTDVTITGSTENEISGTAQMVATNGSVKVDGGATAANTITDADTLVQAGAAVDMSGATNSIAAGARVEAGTDATLTAASSNEVIGGATVSADTVAVSGPENTISGAGTQVTGTTDVTITGSTENEISGTAQVVATNGTVKVAGGTTAANTITGADTLVQAGTAVDIEGDTNSIAAGARVEAGTIATFTAATSNEVGDGAAVSADTVAVSGPENTISGAGTQVTGTTDVSITGSTENEISGTAQVVATNGTVKVAGGTTAANTITGADTLVQAGTAVDIEGDTNSIAAGAEVLAGGSVTIDASESNEVIGCATVDGETVAVTAGSSNTISGTDTSVIADTTVDIDSASNSIAAGAKVEAGTLAAITATRSNEVLDGVTVKGTSVVMDGAENTIDGAGTSVTGATDVTIAGTNATTISGAALVVATNESVVIDGATTAENTIMGADTMVLAGTAADIDGKSNSISTGAAVLAGGVVTIDAAESNAIAGGAQVYGESVSLNAGASNTITGTNTNVSSENTVEMDGASNSIAAGAKVEAGTVAAITATTSNEVLDGATVKGASVVMDGAENTVDGAGTSVTGGADVIISGTNSTTISGAALVIATNESVVINGATTAENMIMGANTMVEAGTTADIEGKSNIISSGAALLAGGAVTLDAVELNEVADGALIYGESVAINGAENVIDGSDTLVKGMSLITITGTVSNTVSDGATVQVSREMPAVALNSPVADSALGIYESGTDVSISSQGQNAITCGASVVSETGSVLVSAGESNIVSGGGTLVEAAADVSILGAENNISTGAQVQAGANVEIAGSNSITSESLNSSRTTIHALAGDVDVSDSNYIKYASILSDGGNIGIFTGSGDKSTWIGDSELLAAGNISIAGDTTDRSDANLAVVTGTDALVLAESITLNSVSVLNTGKGAANICTVEDGDITILHRVDVENATLTAGGNIVVDADQVLNLRGASSLEGKLSGAGDINKSGGDSLLLDYDHTAFQGAIYANGAVGGAEGSVADTDNAGSWLEMTGAGVGKESTMALKNTDLVINTGNACVGTLDTTQDSEANNGETGATLLATGSFTADDNARPDFRLVGSVLEVQKGVAGDELQAANLKLSDATLIKLDAQVDAEGQVSSDVIRVSGFIDMAAAQTGNRVSTATAPVTARVFLSHLGAADSAAEGARATIMEGTMASDINEDVLYDVVRAANGTYQRVLQNRNVHLENKDDRVELVYSRNYRTATKDAQLTAVAGVLQQMSDNFHHSEGTLAAREDAMSRLIDAFDYTRSEAAAVRGLRSVAGAGNVLPRLMQLDSSRHHLSALRRQMALPVCPRLGKGARNRTFNTWITCTGAQDELSGDANMDDYSRTANGFLLGVDRSLTCNLRFGASMGYETASSTSGSVEVDADSLFLDAYAVAVTGRFRHRASVGLASSAFDMKRCVAVEAGYHSFSGQSKSSADGLTLNFGYEFSSDYQLNERSWLTRYLTANLSWHQLDAMKEKGLGAVGLETSYDDEWQADVALGVQYNREFAAMRYQESATFYASAGLHLELLNEQVSAQSRFRGSSAGWEVKSMKRGRFYAEFGAGVMVPLSPAWTATAGAAVEVGAEHTSISGHAGVRYSF